MKIPNILEMINSRTQQNSIDLSLYLTHHIPLHNSNTIILNSADLRQDMDEIHR